MDKKTVGEKIVQDVINRYILSDDFEKDAIRYVYKKISDEYNSLIAECGHYFEHNGFDEFDIVKPEVAKKFQDDMEPLISEREIFRKIFDRVFKYSPDYKDTESIDIDIMMGKR
jgi:hypothetical protein